MSQQLASNPSRLQDARGVTMALSEWAAGFRLADAPTTVRLVARNCLLDWTGVTLAGLHEPLVRKLRAFALAEGGAPRATLLGFVDKTSLRQAALVNGTAGHALDYDDIHRSIRGHPTATVLPAVLAVAEHRACHGEELLAAFIVGFEMICRVGRFMGNSHYDRGWHSTATIGAIGAAAAVSRLLGSDATSTAHAIGLAATQAAGLKAMLGTMAKPLHAGKAAESGVLAALLAADGFTSRTDVLEAVQGFGDTQSDGPDPTACLDGLGQSWMLPQVLFKYHAACYGVHPAVACCIRLRDEHDITPDQVAEVDLRIAEHVLRTANIAEPTTGLQGKFSLCMTAAMALSRIDMGDPAIFSDALMRRPDLVELRRRVTVTPDARFRTMAAAEVRITTRDGIVLIHAEDLEGAAVAPRAQWDSLVMKFLALCTPLMGSRRAAWLAREIDRLPEADSLLPFIDGCRLERSG